MSAPLRLELFVRNLGSRKGAPMARSFEQWVRAALAGRRGGARRDQHRAVRLARCAPPQPRLAQEGLRDQRAELSVSARAGEKSALIGDLAICPAVVAREAREQRKRVRDHFAHLTCMACCTFSATTTRTSAMRPRWKRSSAARWPGSASPTLTDETSLSSFRESGNPFTHAQRQHGFPLSRE